MSSGPARRRLAGVAASHPIAASAAAANEDVQASGIASCQQRPSLCLACLPVWLRLAPVEGLLGAVGSWYRDGDLTVTWAVTWQ